MSQIDYSLRRDLVLLGLVVLALLFVISVSHFGSSSYDLLLGNRSPNESIPMNDYIVYLQNCSCVCG